MSHPPLSAQQLYDAGPLGALIRFSDGTVEPPQRHRRRHAAWRSSNGTGRLVRKAPQKQGVPASFTLHVGDFGTADLAVVKAYRVFAVTSPLSFAILDKLRPGQVAVLHDDLGMPSFYPPCRHGGGRPSLARSPPPRQCPPRACRGARAAHVHLPPGPRPRLAPRRPQRPRRRRHVARGFLLMQLRARRHPRAPRQGVREAAKQIAPTRTPQAESFRQGARPSATSRFSLSINRSGLLAEQPDERRRDCRPAARQGAL